MEILILIVLGYLVGWLLGIVEGAINKIVVLVLAVFVFVGIQYSFADQAVKEEIHNFIEKKIS